MATVIVVIGRLRVGDTVVDAGAGNGRCCWGAGHRRHRRQTISERSRKRYIKKVYLSVVTCFILVYDLYG